MGNTEQASASGTHRSEPSASVILIGMRGTGKTFVGTMAASILSWPCIDADTYFEQKHMGASTGFLQVIHRPSSCLRSCTITATSSSNSPEQPFSTGPSTAITTSVLVVGFLIINLLALELPLSYIMCFIFAFACFFSLTLTNILFMFRLLLKMSQVPLFLLFMLVATF